jgi:hypothetical protein
MALMSLNANTAVGRPGRSRSRRAARVSAVIAHSAVFVIAVGFESSGEHRVSVASLPEIADNTWTAEVSDPSMAEPEQVLGRAGGTGMVVVDSDVDMIKVGLASAGEHSRDRL